MQNNMLGSDRDQSMRNHAVQAKGSPDGENRPLLALSPAT